jgi:hypothetical protein
MLAMLYPMFVMLYGAAVEVFFNTAYVEVCRQLRTEEMGWWTWLCSFFVKQFVCSQGFTIWFYLYCAAGFLLSLLSLWFLFQIARLLWKVARLCVRICAAVFGFCEWFCRAIDRSPVKSVIRSAGIDNESLVAGSEMTKAQIPSCQAQFVVELEGGDKKIVGSALRIANRFFFPTHLLTYPGKAVVTAYCVKGEKEYKVDLAKCQEMLTDVTCTAVLEESVFSVLGVSKPSIGLVAAKITDTVRLVSSTGMSSLGCLNADVSRGFGTLVYNGSTVKGCSGSAYMSGGRLVGMHMCGGTVNQGIMAMYLHVRARCEYELVVKEGGGPDDDTAKFMEEQERQRDAEYLDVVFDVQGKEMRIRWDHRTGNVHGTLDELIETRRVQRRLKEADDPVREEFLSDIDATLKDRYHYVPENGDAQYSGEHRGPASNPGLSSARPQSSPDSDSSEKNAESESTKRQKLIQRLQAYSNEQLRKFLAREETPLRKMPKTASSSATTATSPSSPASPHN